ncbi:MAG: glycosyltransferase [Chloroflexi bacterium]|nr:glycosyltransferase [Chloroflexota bacterium]
MEGNPRQIIEGDQAQAWLKTGTNPFTFMKGLSGILGPMLLKGLKDTYEACQGEDAIIYSTLGGLAAYHAAEKLGLGVVPAFLQPASPTCEFSNSTFPRWLRLGGPFNRWTYGVSEQLLWRMMGKSLNEARQAVLGLPPLKKAWFAEGHSRRWPILYGYSPSVIPKPADWGDWLHVTGYWFLDPPATWRPPADLIDFLTSGPPPVCIGFGSMNDRDRETVTAIVLDALALARCRGILVSGWGGISSVRLPANVYQIHDVPYSWLYPHVAAVVHHGGAGTTAAGVRAGVPSVIVPFFSDQMFWAERVFRLGAGTKPIPRNRLSAKRLAGAIGLALNDSGIRKRAAELGEQVRAEDGVARAAECFDGLVTRIQPVGR